MAGDTNIFIVIIIIAIVHAALHCRAGGLTDRSQPIHFVADQQDEIVLMFGVQSVSIDGQSKL